MYVIKFFYPLPEKAVRSCINVTSPFGMRDTCLSGEIGDEDLTVCMCLGDLCNSASLAGPTAIIVTVSALVAWFYTR